MGMMPTPSCWRRPSGYSSFTPTDPTPGSEHSPTRRSTHSGVAIVVSLLSVTTKSASVCATPRFTMRA